MANARQGGFGSRPQGGFNNNRPQGGARPHGGARPAAPKEGGAN